MAATKTNLFPDRPQRVPNELRAQARLTGQEPVAYVVQLLSAHATFQEAATAAKVHRNTLRRWVAWAGLTA